MKSNIYEKPELRTYGGIPEYWNGTEGYQYSTPDKIKEDGWRDVVMPKYNSATEKLGELFYSKADDYVTYEVVPRTQQEIETEILAQAEEANKQAIDGYMKSLALAQAQGMSDEDALPNADLFPLWTENIAVEADAKYRFWNAEHTEIWLWKCVQGHTTQAGWEPYNVPALWVRVGEEGQILKWVQPTGSHDAYQKGDKVYWQEPADVWQSDVDNNVWEPGVYGWTKL